MHAVRYETHSTRRGGETQKPYISDYHLPPTTYHLPPTTTTTTTTTRSVGSHSPPRHKTRAIHDRLQTSDAGYGHRTPENMQTAGISDIQRASDCTTLLYSTLLPFLSRLVRGRLTVVACLPLHHHHHSRTILSSSTEE
jgi:hypothetical protein